MKINFILPGIGLAGGVRVVAQYAKQLSERGHDVTVLYPTIPPKMDCSLIDPAPRIYQLLGSFRRFLVKMGFESFEVLDVDWFDETPEQIPHISPVFQTYAARNVPEADATIATSWETAYFVAGLKASKGEKFYFIQHYEIWETWNDEQAWKSVQCLSDDSSLYPIEMADVKPASRKARRQKRLVDSTFNLQLEKITIASWIEELLNRKFGQTVQAVIHNSVDHSTFYPESSGTTNDLTLLLPYRDLPWKGKRELLGLIEQLSESFTIDINTYGPGDEADLHRSVTHHLRVTDEDLRRLYSNADIFVFPSWVEGFGLPILEAMACECAVVSTEVGFLKNHTNVPVQTVPPRDQQELFCSVSTLIENDTLRERLQAEAREYTKRRSWNQSAGELEEVLGQGR
jgi:glycosyltransferase involved in cell wall biosynthesis